MLNKDVLEVVLSYLSIKDKLYFYMACKEYYHCDKRILCTIIMNNYKNFKKNAYDLNNIVENGCDYIIMLVNPSSQYIDYLRENDYIDDTGEQFKEALKFGMKFTCYDMSCESRHEIHDKNCLEPSDLEDIVGDKSIIFKNEPNENLSFHPDFFRVCEYYGINDEASNYTLCCRSQWDIECIEFQDYFPFYMGGCNTDSLLAINMNSKTRYGYLGIFVSLEEDSCARDTNIHITDILNGTWKDICDDEATKELLEEYTNL